MQNFTFEMEVKQNTFWDLILILRKGGRKWTICKELVKGVSNLPVASVVAQFVKLWIKQWYVSLTQKIGMSRDEPTESREEDTTPQNGLRSVMSTTLWQKCKGHCFYLLFFKIWPICQWFASQSPLALECDQKCSSWWKFPSSSYRFFRYHNHQYLKIWTLFHYPCQLANQAKRGSVMNS